MIMSKEIIKQKINLFISILLSIVLLSIPVDVALTFKYLGNTTIVNYIIVILDSLLLLKIIVNEKLSFSSEYTLIITIYNIYVLFFLIPDLTLNYETGNRIFGLWNCSLLFVLLLQNNFSEQEKNTFLYATLASIYVAGIIFYFYVDKQMLMADDRIFLEIGTNIDPNTVGTNMCISTASIFELLSNNNKKYIDLLLFGALIILFIILFLVGSRGALLGNLTIILICMFLYRKIIFIRIKNNLKFYSIIFILFLCICVYGFLSICNIVSSNMINRYNLSEIVNGNGSGRYDIWANTTKGYFNLPLRQIVFGTGFGSFISVFSIKRASHNIYLNMLVETGLFGLYMFMFLLYLLLKRSYLNKNFYGFTSLVGLCVCGMTLEMQTLRVFWIAMWICTWKRVYSCRNDKTNLLYVIFKKDR